MEPLEISETVKALYAEMKAKGLKLYDLSKANTGLDGFKLAGLRMQLMALEDAELSGKK